MAGNPYLREVGEVTQRLREDAVLVRNRRNKAVSGRLGPFKGALTVINREPVLR